MNYTLLQSTIANRLNRDDLTTETQNWIYNARRNICEGVLPLIAKGEQAYHRFSWTFGESTLTTVAGTDLVDFPDLYIDEQDMFLASANRPLVKISINEMNDSFYGMNNSTTQGQPTNYAILGEQFKFYPIPSGVYNITCYHYKYPAVLVNGSDEFTIDKRCPDLIVELCCYEGSVFLHSQERQVQYGESAKNRYFNLVVSDKRRKWSNADLRMKTWRDQNVSLYNGRRMQ